MLYLVLNLLCHLVHLAFILLMLLGWLFAPLQTAHLGLVLGMLGSWFVLGRWLGPGYCPITDLHWRIKAALGPGRPQTSDIHFVLSQLGWPLNPAKVDHTVGIAAIAHRSPTDDMLSTSVYASFQHNPPGIEFMGKKTWAPGKNLQKLIAASFGIQPKEQQHMVQHPGIEDIGKRMLLAWAEGVPGLRDARVQWADPRC